METKEKLAKGISLAAITVSNLEKTKHLFCDLLGLDLAEHCEEYNWMEIKGEEGAILGVGLQNSECTDNEMQAGIGENAIVSIEVGDIVFVKELLEKNGIQFIGDIMEIPGEVKLALFKDFDGNSFFLAEKLK